MKVPVIFLRSMLKPLSPFSSFAQENGYKNVPMASTSSKDAMAEEVDSYLNQAISLAKEKVADHLHGIDELSITQSKWPQQQETEILYSITSELKTTTRNY